MDKLTFGTEKEAAIGDMLLQSYDIYAGNNVTFETAIFFMVAE